MYMWMYLQDTDLKVGPLGERLCAATPISLKCVLLDTPASHAWVPAVPSLKYSVTYFLCQSTWEAINTYASFVLCEVRYFYIFITFIMCVSVWAHACSHQWVLFTEVKGQLLPTVWDAGIEFRSSGLTASALTFWIILTAPFYCILKNWLYFLSRDCRHLLAF